MFDCLGTGRRGVRLSWDWEAWCLTVWGVIPPPIETLLEIRGGNIFTA